MILRLLIGLLLVPASHASAAETTLFGGLNYAAPSDIRSGIDQRSTGLAAPIFGLGLDLALAGLPLSFETGLLLRSSESETGITPATRASGSWTDIPLLLHYHFDSSVSLGIGGYWGFFRNGSAIQKSESPDSGLILDLRARIHLTELWSMVIDGRYAHGLANLSSIPGDTYNTRSVQFMLGVSHQVFKERTPANLESP